MTVDTRSALPGLAEIRAELIAIRERANGIGVDVVKDKAPRHHVLRAVLDELRQTGRLSNTRDVAGVHADDHAQAVVNVVRCAVSELVPDYRSQVILQHTLLDGAKKAMDVRRSAAKTGIFYSENSDAAFAKLEKKAYTDLADHLTAARESPCWIEEADAAREREVRDALVAAANMALTLSASGRFSSDVVRRVARRVLEELAPEGMDRLFELLAITRGATTEPDVRLLIAAVLDRYPDELAQWNLYAEIRDELVGSSKPFLELLERGLSESEPMGTRPSDPEERRRAFEQLAEILQREESGGWPSLPRAEGEMAFDFQDF